MKKFSPACALVLLLLSGCARDYVITMNNGTQVGSKGKPKLENGTYHFTDARGNPAAVPAGRVAQVEPASQAKENKKFGFINSSGK